MIKSSNNPLENVTKPNMFLNEMPFSVKEGYKTLRTNIMYSLPEKNNNCIGYTSANRSEGKSTLVLNTALSFAQIDKKIIVIDCDLRIPTIHTKIDIEQFPGLSEYLINENELDEIIHPYNENIDIIASGRIPKEPSALLESKKLADLITKLKEEYDYVFIDLPPVNVVPDALIMSKQLSGFVVVVKHNTTRNKDIKKTIKQLRFIDAKILGFAYNYAPIETKKHYYYYK